MPRKPSPAAQKPGFILRRRAEADLDKIGDYTLEHWGESRSSASSFVIAQRIRASRAATLPTFLNDATQDVVEGEVTKDRDMDAPTTVRGHQSRVHASSPSSNV